MFEIGRFGPDQKQINLLSWRNMPGASARARARASARKQRPASAGDWIEASCDRRGHLLLDWEGKGRLQGKQHSCD